MDVHHASDIQQLQRFPWSFHLLAVLGALYLGAVTFRLLAYLGLPNFLRRPTDLRRRYGAWAVVTGPTSGIGRSMAFELARRGLNVVLVGRDPDKLRDVSDTITKTHAGVQTKTVLFDLSFVSTAQGETTNAILMIESVVTIQLARHLC
jgi:17beta-estradiol 17-dehydrogenase / very-long-chain 3-oxoacyl-CoA reductase